MKCPYCISEVNDAANVCPTCRRDIYLFKPLEVRIENLEGELETRTAEKLALEARVAELEEELERHAENETRAINANKPRRIIATLLITVVASLALLLAAHALIILVYDLKPLYLRIASLLIPVPFGIFMYVRHPSRFWLEAFVAACIALAAVLAMSAVVAHVDKTPILPQDMRDWREFIEYTCSITFAFVTGMLIGILRSKRRETRGQPNAMVLALAKLMAKDSEGESGVKKLVEKISGIARAAAPAVSGAISAYTGIKAVLGDS